MFRLLPGVGERQISGHTTASAPQPTGAQCQGIFGVSGSSRSKGTLVRPPQPTPPAAPGGGGVGLSEQESKTARNQEDRLSASEGVKR
jgi:hypothetical protein